MNNVGKFLKLARNVTEYILQPIHNLLKETMSWKSE